MHAAYRLARERGDEVLASALDKALKVARRMPSAALVLAAIKARGGHDIVPFVRDAADVTVACVIGCAPKGEELRLFSEAAGADIGFLQVWEDAAGYVDRAPLPSTEGRREVELMAADSMGRLMVSLRQLDECPAVVEVAEDPSVLLEVQSEMLHAWPVKVATIGLTLMRPDGAGADGWALRRLGACKVQLQSSASFSVRAPASVAMEVHAAALAGHWLELSSPTIRLLTPLPDFSPGVRVDAWLQPRGAFAQAVGSDVDRAVTLPRELGLDLCRRHRWCLPSDLAACLEAVGDQ